MVYGLGVIVELAVLNLKQHCIRYYVAHSNVV